MPYTDNIILASLSQADFKTNFSTDFDYTVITDSLILRAFNEAYLLINPGNYSSNDKFISAFLYASAHLLVLNYRNANINIQSIGEEKVDKVGTHGVSEGYTIPKRYKNSVLINQFAKTSYGQRFLSLTLPSLVGNMRGGYRITNY
jgi:hypothetical protein